MATYERSGTRAKGARAGVSGRPGRGPANRSADAQRAAALESAGLGGSEQTALTVAILDRDPGFQTVLAKRMESHGWEHRTLPVRISAKALAATEADALIVDL